MLVVDEFEFDKTKIPTKHVPALTELRTRLAKEPDASVICDGNTDTVGSENYNRDLGMRRAEAVKAFLTAEKGVNASRIKTITHGEMKPAKGEPPAKPDPDPGVKDPKNRRVEVRVEWPKGGKGKGGAPEGGEAPEPGGKPKGGANPKGHSKPKGKAKPKKK